MTNLLYYLKAINEMPTTPEEVAIANKTSRAGGAVGSKAIVPKLVREHVKKGDKILDFGAGKAAMHAVDLRKEGHNVTAHEFGSNINPDLHDKNALSKKYDVVYASNVLNVQVTEPMLHDTISDIKKTMKKGAKFIANYPSEPRKMGKPASEFKELLSKYFSSIEQIGGTGSAPVWLMKV